MSSDAPTTPATLPGLVAAGSLDAPLAALAWLLLERGVPTLVAGGDERSRAALADGLEGALPPGRRPGPVPGGDRLVRVSGSLGAATPPGILRAALGATTGRSGLLALVEADDLAGVLDVLARQGLAADEASFLGTVLVLGPAATDGAGRVQAAHYLRPIARDAGGHTRRLGPAVLAVWDELAGSWEDFAWGIAPDLAERSRIRAGDFEVERAARATLVADLAAARSLDAASFAAGAAHLAHREGRPAF